MIDRRDALKLALGGTAMALAAPALAQAKPRTKLVFLGTKAAWPHLGESHGLVINTASVAGHGGGVGGIAHSATKWAVRGMTHVMAAEGAAVGIRAVFQFAAHQREPR